MNWLLTVFYFLVFLFIIRKLNFFIPKNIPFSLIAFAFLYKTAAGILLGYVYAVHYHGEGDTIKYFQDGNVLYSILISNPVDYLKILFGIGAEKNFYRENYFSHMFTWYNRDFDLFFNDCRTMIRVNSVIRIFSFGIYNVHVVFFSFFSFAGFTALFRFFSSAIKGNHKLFYSGMLLLPSVAFWSSGALKEAIVIFTLGSALYFTMKFIQNKSVRNIFLLLLCFSLLTLAKFYYIIALLPGIAAWLWSINEKKIFLKFLLTHFIWFSLLFSVKFILPDYGVPQILSAKQNNFINLAIASHSGSIIHSEKLQPAWSDVLLKSPNAFLTSLTTPITFSSGNIYELLSSIETIFILLILIAALLFFRKPEKANYPYLFFALSFVLITFTLVGLTTPVAGALVRYKSITLPFLLFLTIYFTDFKKIVKIFSSHGLRM